MKFTPLANRVFLEEIAESKVTRGGIAIPDVARKNKHASYGRVLAAGPGRYTADGTLVPCSVKVGDVVMFPRQAPAVIPIVDDQGNEKDVLMLWDNDICAVVSDLPVVTHIAGLDGAFMSLAPQSLARPDVAYANEDAADRSIADLRQSGAPPDVIEEVAAAYRDDV